VNRKNEFGKAQEFIEIEKIIKGYLPGLTDAYMVQVIAVVDAGTIKTWRIKSYNRFMFFRFVHYYFGKKEFYDFIKHPEIRRFLETVLIYEGSYYFMNAGKEIGIAFYKKKYNLDTHEQGADMKFEWDYIWDNFRSFPQQTTFAKAIEAAHEEYKKFILNNYSGKSHFVGSKTVRVDIIYNNKPFKIKIPAYWISKNQEKPGGALSISGG
jgi:hypothetical protein